MSRLFLVVFLAASLMGLNAIAAQAQEPKDHVILLFGARWCAPCMAEYRDLPNLARAAAPDNIKLAWVDRPIAPTVELPSGVGRIPVEEARHIADHVAGVGYGLPFSAMFDAEGHVCAIWRHPLAAADIERLRLLCKAAAKASR